jgi:hypothetical protein
LGAAILTAPETDPPREVLRAGPVPLWRTLALRLAGWLLLGATPVLILAVGHGGIAGWRTTDLVWGALPNFLLVAAVGFLAASRTSVLGGGRLLWPWWSAWMWPGGPGRHGCPFSF